MPKTANNPTGGCMCGSVRFEAAGAPSRVLHCHCRSCRAHTGAPMATLAVFKADQVNFSGDERKAYQSAPGVDRAFCANCGTSLTWETVFGDEGALCAVHISSFDDPEALMPTAHSFYSERILWFDVADHLPRHEGFVAGSEPVCHGPAMVEPPGSRS
ncbi:MAG: GFA family protein [Alphaproteobacteria bacterium]|nr:GFA family protein [Alphaproteobacteria bacterium]